MPAKEVVHFRTDRKFTKCGLNLTWSRDPRFQGNRPRGLTSDKKKATCKNCLAVLKAPSAKVHYAPYKFVHKFEHTAVCGFVWRKFESKAHLVWEDHDIYGPVTCKNCKRALKALKVKK